MKRFRIKTGLMFASWALMLIFGCHKKKPPVPPEVTPPTLISEIPLQPEEPPAGTQPQPQPTPSETPAPPAEKPAQKPPRHSKPHSPPPRNPEESEKPAPTAEAKSIPPTRVVIQPGGGSAGTESVGGGAPSDSSALGQQSTQQLLDSTENNLRNIKRDLSSDEKSILSQIQDYITQSKQAAKDGDNVRAHNLALRARLLSDELVKGQ